MTCKQSGWGDSHGFVSVHRQRLTRTRRACPLRRRLAYANVHCPWGKNSFRLYIGATYGVQPENLFSASVLRVRTAFDLTFRDCDDRRCFITF